MTLEVDSNALGSSATCLRELIRMSFGIEVVSKFSPVESSVESPAESPVEGNNEGEMC